MVHQVHKAARKSALDSIYAHIDGKSHILHEGCGSLKLGTLAKIVEYLKGKFPWITCNIIDKAYRKHPQSFVKASSLHLRGVRSNIQYMQNIQVNPQVFLIPTPPPLREPPLPTTKCKMGGKPKGKINRVRR